MYRCKCGKEYNSQTSLDEHKVSTICPSHFSKKKKIFIGKKTCPNGNFSYPSPNINPSACHPNDHLHQCANRNVPQGFTSDHLENNCDNSNSLKSCSSTSVPCMRHFSIDILQFLLTIYIMNSWENR